jgi:sugar transferase (PEP-CTERM/EpsH1 system associated)
MKRILLVSYRFPYPLIDGSRIRIYNIGRILAQRYLVDLLVVNEGHVADEHLRELKRIFNTVIVYPFHPAMFKVNTLRGLLSKDPLQTYYYHFKKVQQWIDNHYIDYDLIFCFHIRMAMYLKGIINRPKAIDITDALSINYREGQDRVNGIWKLIYRVENHRLLSYELKVLDAFDKVFISSSFDKAYLDENSECQNDHLIVIPNGIKAELFSRAKKFKELQENWLVFLGRMDYAPNVDAVTYFVKDVLPLIKEKADVKFFIVGTNPTKHVVNLHNGESIFVTGFVDDPYEYLEKAKVIVAPLRFSSGIQNKVLEAMALNKAVITTSKAARGIEGENGKHFIIADNEQEMALNILDLLANEYKRKEIGYNAKQLVESKYCWNSIEKKLLDEIEELLS